MPVALVTGGAQRLGAAISIELGRCGCDVAVHYHQSSDAANDVVNQLKAMGRRAVALQADLLDERQSETLVDRARDALGAPVTCLVNNASIFDYDSIETATRNSWDRHMESNLRAPFVLTQKMAAAIPDTTFDERGEPVASGLIINMLDQRVRKLTPDFMTYTIAKMGLWAFTQTAARALAPKIRVNAIGPGPTLIGARQSEAHFNHQRQNTVLKRGSNPEDITAAVSYLYSAKSVTGQLICTDGGQHLGWQTPDIVGEL